MKQSLILFICFFSAQMALCQIKQANDAFDHHHYDIAIELYHKAIRKNLHNGEAVTKLAICYWKTEQNTEAEYWFNRAVYMNEQPEVKLWYSQLLIHNEKYEMAATWLDKYMKVETDEWKIKQASNLSNYCKSLINGSVVEEACSIVPLGINSSSLDFAPHMHQGTLYFATNREGVTERGGERDPWTSQRFTDVYSCKWIGTASQNVVPSSLPTSPYHEGPMCLSADGEELFITVSDFDDKKRRFDQSGNTRVTIACYQKDQDKWVFKGKLPFYSPEINLVHPSISEDGLTLLFASDMAGGKGGMDLYITHRDSKNTSWGAPEPINSANTSGNELFPSFGPNGSIYFSSDLLIGFGGLDLFEIKEQDGQWGEPQNLGAPINSAKDDFSITWIEAGKSGIISSNRNKNQLDDLLYFEFINGIHVEGMVVDCMTGNPIPGAEVEVSFSGENRVIYSDRNGAFKTLVQLCPRISASASHGGYNTHEGCNQEQSFDVTAMKEGDVLQMSLSLNRDVGDINTQCYLKGTTIEMPYAMPVADVAVEIWDEETLVSSFRSSEWGAFFVPVEKGKTYVLKAQSNDGLSTEMEVNVDGSETHQTAQLQLWGEEQPVHASNQLHVDMKLVPGQVIQLYHIYFDRNESTLKEDALKDLDILYELLVKYPEMTGEVMAHADARASDEYNLVLSQKRAEAAVAYLVSRGIDPSRLFAHGYGETMPRKRCEKPEDCSEEDHARNRRVEFRVLELNKNIDTISKEAVRFSAN
ncbi:MAG: OmpA family protein [Flavobacteriales bacterium]|nr:OmpA family protein [Flavobacteriales bacterium]